MHYYFLYLHLLMTKKHVNRRGAGNILIKFYFWIYEVHEKYGLALFPIFV